MSSARKKRAAEEYEDEAEGYEAYGFGLNDDASREKGRKPPPKKKTPVTKKQQQQQLKQPTKRKASSSSPKVCRPPPPPPPPAALVKLLQSNKAVLKYFQSLHANLDADVQIWKGRAKEYQQRKEELEAQLQALRKEKNMSKTEGPVSEKIATASTAKKKATHNQPEESDQTHDETFEEAAKEQALENDEIDVPERIINKEAQEEGDEINDDMLEFDSDDDDDEDDVGGSSARGADVIAPEPQAEAAAESRLETRMHQALFAFESSDSSSDDDKESARGAEPGIFEEDSDDDKESAKRAEPGIFVEDSDDDKESAKRAEPGIFDEDSDDDKESERAENPETFEEGMEDAVFGNSASKFVTEGKAARPEAELLCEAFYALERLGVTLVKEELVAMAEVEKDSQIQTGSPVATKMTICDSGDIGAAYNGNQQHEKYQESPHQQQPTWVRRSDEDVAADLMWAIHSLSRVQLLHRDLVNTFPPFATQKLIPSCNFCNPDQQNHPIVKAKELLIRALLILDTYCSADMYTEETWLDIVQNVASDDDDDEHKSAVKIAIGLKNRKGLVESFVDSLDGEITQLWPIQDRSNYLLTTAFHIMEVDDEDATDKRLEMNIHGHETEKDSSSSPAGDTKTEGTNHALVDSKIQGRLSSLLERCVLVQVVIALHLSRNDHERAASLIWRYFISSVPCPKEELPKLPPVMSLVVLESMLLLNRSTMCWPPDPASQDNQPCSLWKLLFYGEEEGSEIASVAGNALNLSIAVVGSIWQLRERKAKSSRVRDLAKVEIAAYQRLLDSGIGSCEESFVDDWKNQAGEAAELLCQELENLEWKTNCYLPALAYQLCFILGGRDPNKSLHRGSHRLFLPTCQAIREIEIRHLENYRSAIRSDDGMSTAFQYWLSDPLKSENLSSTLNLEFQTSVLRGGAILSNGNAVCQCVEAIIESSRSLMGISNEERSVVLSALLELSKLPLVRVINLRSRPDRMKAFYAQAMASGLRVVHGVAPLGDQVAEEGSNPYFGLHAFDGRGKWFEASGRLSNEVGPQFGRLVETHWRPNELKAFDSNAPNAEGLVRSSPSERACALSHIGCWKGCLRSFRFNKLDDMQPSVSVLRRPETLKRLFHQSGFAEGPALHLSNKEMDPAPVCVILEDDAILVDRFSERLQDLLNELPRDFHFCSLGYSRPKTAPIVSYRKHIGIPTHLFYLTGYLISEAGAKYLLDSLPVVGPVDSWVGLKMTSNFDNIFGTIIGVGQNSKPLVDSLPKKDLCTILQFRAFCALQPLCSQRVGNLFGGPTTGRAWRQRDTDIEYSGNLGCSSVRAQRT